LNFSIPFFFFIRYANDVFKENNQITTELRKEILSHERQNTFDPADIEIDGFSYFYNPKKNGNQTFCRRNIKTGEIQVKSFSLLLLLLFDYYYCFV